MKSLPFLSTIRPAVLAAVLAVCAILSPSASRGGGLSGDTIQGNLTIPWSPQSGNYFTQDANGYATSSVPIYAEVGPGIEFGYYPHKNSTFTWQMTVDVSDNRIAINETLSDPNPGYWLGSFSSWTLTLSDLDWAGAAGIANVSYLSQDPNIGVQSFDAHSIQFSIGEITVYPTGPYSISRTTIVELSPIPEPSIAALGFGWMSAVLLRRRYRL